MSEQTYNNLDELKPAKKIEPETFEAPEPGEMSAEEILQQAEYEAWQEEQLQQKLLFEERQQWEAAMPHKNLIRMDKMKYCPHQKSIPILENIIYPGALTTISADPKA